MNVKEFAAAMEQSVPAAFSESWDRDGVMVLPDGDLPVKKVLVALDCTSVAIEKAKAAGCNVIVTHHPLIFDPLSSLTEEDPVAKRVLSCVKNGIAVFSYHTRLDSMPGGVNDCLAAAIGLKNTEAFLPYARIGDVEEQPFETFLARVREGLRVETTECVRSRERVCRVAIMSGSGKDGIEAAVRAGADTYLTGEVKHENKIACKEYGINLICASHHATERVVLPFLAEKIGEMGIETVIHDFTEAEEYGI
ncbi:MAG: Nif3-like dinuclear metal center hexameric protein [Clostridiales bacterium]|nr:Nif3-like dinuclear metal center hexameric protein [Candidatus Coliplasma caballi]